jgi:hypothetical protein
MELGFLDPTRHFIHARFTEKGRSPAENTLLFSRFREIRFPRPHVLFRVTKGGDTTFEVELQSKCFAKAVSLETKAALSYSDNFVDLIPSVKKSIVVTTRREMELEEFEESLKVSDGIFP